MSTRVHAPKPSFWSLALEVTIFTLASIVALVMSAGIILALCYRHG